MLRNSIEKLMKGENLTALQCQQALHEILHGADPLQAAAFLVLLHGKGETAEEVLGFVTAMRSVMTPVSLPYPVMDIVGTGGDGANTVNISTAASIVAANLGVKIAKHGNRSVSSRCGSADILEALGINIAMSSSEVAQCIEQIGIGFCFAPQFHSAMLKIAPIRKSLGVRTTFNILGPLLNPAQAQYYVVGVYDPKYLSLYADVLQKLGVRRALIVHGNGLDELSCLGPVQAIEVTATEQRELTIDPAEYGFNYCALPDLQGGEPAENKKLLLAALRGEPSAIADTLALNAGVALAIAEKVPTIAEGVRIAQQHLRSGAPYQLLQRWIRLSQQGERAHA